MIKTLISIVYLNQKKFNDMDDSLLLMRGILETTSKQDMRDFIYERENYNFSIFVLLCFVKLNIEISQ